MNSHCFYVSLATIVVVTTMLGGCCLPGTGCPGEYSHRALNDTPTTMTDVTIRWTSDGYAHWDGHKYLFSCLDDGFGGYSNYGPESIPSDVDVHWRTNDGVEHNEHIHLAGQIPNLATFAGTIAYKLFENDAVALPVPRWLEDRNERLGKSTIP